MYGQSKINVVQSMYTSVCYVILFVCYVKLLHTIASLSLIRALSTLSLVVGGVIDGKEQVHPAPDKVLIDF